MVKRAVLIGVNYTGQSAPLKGCINDAHNVANFLIRNFEYDPSNMLILTDNPQDMTSGHLPPFKQQKLEEKNEEEENSEEEEEKSKKKDKKEKDKKEKGDKKEKDKKEKGEKKEKKEKKDKGDKKDKKQKKKGKENKKELDDADLLYVEATRGVEEICRGAPNFLRGPATRAKIIEAANWLVTGASEGDCLFFHFSGHGVQVKDQNGDEEDGLDEAICPMDYKSAGIIVDDELHDILVSKLPRGVRLTAILDCCHSGSGLDLPYFYQPVDDNKKMNKKIKKKNKKKEKKVEEEEDEHKTGITVMLSGCRDEQVSADVVLEGKATGAVSYSFICSMQKFNCKISYSDLLGEMKKVIAANVKSIIQCPMLSSNRQNFDFAANFTA